MSGWRGISCTTGNGGPLAVYVVASPASLRVAHEAPREALHRRASTARILAARLSCAGGAPRERVRVAGRAACGGGGTTAASRVSRRAGRGHVKPRDRERVFRHGVAGGCRAGALSGAAAEGERLIRVCARHRDGGARVPGRAYDPGCGRVRIQSVDFEGGDVVRRRGRGWLRAGDLGAHGHGATPQEEHPHHAASAESAEFANRHRWLGCPATPSARAHHLQPHPRELTPSWESSFLRPGGAAPNFRSRARGPLTTARARRPPAPSPASQKRARRCPSA